MRDQTIRIFLERCRKYWERFEQSGMNQKQLLLRVGLMVGIVGVLVVRWMGSNESADAFAHVSGDTVPVLVASKYIAAHQMIKPSLLKTQYVPKAFIPPGAFSSAQELKNQLGQLRYETLISLPAGQVLTHSQVADISKQHGMADLLEPGHVAVAFAVDKVRGAGGWVQPGDRITIFQHNGKMLFADVSVLAVDKIRLGQQLQKNNQGEEELMMPEESGDIVLTVALNPLEAVKLMQSREQGELSILLRSFGDVLPWDSVS